MVDFPVIFLLFAHDGKKIADTVKKSLEKNETTVHNVDVSQVSEAPPSSVLVLFLTPGMLSVLKSPNAPDLNGVYSKSSMCVLFFHDTINFTGDSVQQLLQQTIPSFQKWSCFPTGNRVLTIVLKILELLDTVEEVQDQEFPGLVSECQLYPESVWKDKQTVFISFNYERTQEDKVTVNVDELLFEATWFNPYTFMFKYNHGCNANGERLVVVSVNGDCKGTSKIFVKDRNQILLEDINDLASPLYFLQDIVKSIKDTESEIHNASIDVKLLDGTKELIKMLAQLPDFSESYKPDSSYKQNKKIQEEPSVNEDLSYNIEPEVRRSNSQSIRKRREESIPDCSRKDAHAPCISTELQSKRISKALQNLSAEEDLPLIKVNPDLKRSLPGDFFESVLESNNGVC